MAEQSESDVQVPKDDCASHIVGMSRKKKKEIVLMTWEAIAIVGQVLIEVCLDNIITVIR